MEIQRRITEKVNQENRNKGSGTERPVSLIMMDVDDFKKVNDTYGHAEGDQVLIRLAEMLKRVIDRNVPGCSAGRWGGEEFMVLLPGVDLERADTVAEIMRQEFNKLEFELCGHQTMSLGVAELIPGENPDAFAMRVDDALYRAKGNGKNRVERA
jgi:diguanylate cyclase (GGDEF)-like protein